MPIFDLYSKRQKRIRGEMPDVFQYDNFPEEFRNQVVYILIDAIGRKSPLNNFALEAFKYIHYAICREYGWLRLNSYSDEGNYIDSVLKFLSNCKDASIILDIIDFSFKLINTRIREDEYQYSAMPNIKPDEAINELNARFLEHGIGYKFESGKIIRIDSEFIHQEAIKPTLQILSSNKYAGANEEFLIAHDHYRHGRYKECLNECLKSFESVLKVICTKRHWSFNDTDTSKKLLEICFQNGLIPSYLLSHYSSLLANLESGVPTIRNKLSGHGQGLQQTEVPEYFVAYMINLTASSILFLTKAEIELH